MSRTSTLDTSLKTVRKHDNDCGSIEVQIVTLTEMIARLSGHFKKFPKDFSSKRGMLKAVSRRRSFLKYLENNDLEGFQKVAAYLNARSK